jgi:DNA polymerase III epsilon subunit-like protein
MTLIFDTETSGKADFKAPPEAPQQPRLVQLAALLLDSELTEVGSMNFIIKPVGFTISDEVAKIHGITQAKAEAVGVSEHGVLLLFREWLLMSKRIVAHNLKFDGFILGKAFAVHQLVVDKMPEPYCTMLASMNVCQLPGNFPGQYKWPSLQEAHEILLGEPFTGAHDAFADVRACARIYTHLIHGDRPKARPVEQQRPIPQEQSVDVEYNDATLMPFGKHRGTPLGRLPESYCNWLYDQENLSDKRLYAWLHGEKKIVDVHGQPPTVKYEEPCKETQDGELEETPLDKL